MRNLCDTIFHMKTNVLKDFHMCISVPLSKELLYFKITLRGYHMFFEKPLFSAITVFFAKL